MKPQLLAIQIFVVLLLIACPSCQQEDVFSQGSSNVEDKMVLSFISDPMEQYKVTSRADNIKDEDEKRINQLYVFFFNEAGDYLKGGYLTGYDSENTGGYYALSQGTTVLKLDNNFVKPEEAKNAIVYAVANIDPFLFADIDETTGCPTNIHSMSDLDKMIYEPKESISLGIPEYGMPMVMKKQIDLTQPDSENGNIIELEALMSRVDVNIQLESDITDDNYPRLTLTDWTAKNIPTQVPFVEPGAGEQTGDSWEDEEWTTSITTPLQRTIYNKNGEISFSFYMFENVQEAEWKKDDGENWQSSPNSNDPKSLYPEEILSNDDLAYQKQRYKPYLANKNASAIELHAFYSTYNETGSGTATYEVRYTLYLGANFSDNFQVKRNHRYENNITIKGLTEAGTNPNHITFDARVNVKTEGNEYYIAILRERKHDAHFCVTPMDVYLFADEATAQPSMEVILGKVSEGKEEADEGNVPAWIRMEKICAADMENGTVTESGFQPYDRQNGTGTHLATSKSWFAGNGKRAFFTYDLVTNTLKESGKKVTIENSRDRVYFYLDENLLPEDRTATVTLIYKEKGKEVKRRTLEISQTHLLPVQLRNGKGTIYMEQYEEYLDHYDPLDEHRTDQIYDGLPWAKENSSLWNRTIDRLYQNEAVEIVSNPYDKPQLIINDGLPYTSFIIYLSGDQGRMDLNSQPQSALQYCHNKNKRTEDGWVPSNYEKTFWGYYWEKSNSAKWFLPGIRQMEDALTEYYTTYGEFQDSYYWSCSAGEADGKDDGQNPTFARATKVNPDGSYVESGGKLPEYPKSGYAPREQSLRIRAFRIDLEEVNY